MTYKVKRQIIATSGGFAIETRNRRLDKYILSQATVEQPKICFIGTASGDSKNYIKRFYNFFTKENCIPTHLELFKGKVIHIEDYILDQDIIYVGGGNSRNMFAIWRDRGIDKILIKAYNNGIIMSGISAGSLCWFEHGLTDSIPGKLTSMKCMGLIKGINSPFFDNRKKKALVKQIKLMKIKSGLANEIGVGIHFENEKLMRTVTSRKAAKAFRFNLIKEQVIEKVLVPEYLEIKLGKLKNYSH